MTLRQRNIGFAAEHAAAGRNNLQRGSRGQRPEERAEHDPRGMVDFITLLHRRHGPRVPFGQRWRRGPPVSPQADAQSLPDQPLCGQSRKHGWGDPVLDQPDEAGPNPIVLQRPIAPSLRGRQNALGVIGHVGLRPTRRRMHDGLEQTLLALGGDVAGGPQVGHVTQDRHVAGKRGTRGIARRRRPQGQRVHPNFQHVDTLCGHARLTEHLRLIGSRRQVQAAFGHALRQRGGQPGRGSEPGHHAQPLGQERLDPAAERVAAQHPIRPVAINGFQSCHDVASRRVVRRTRGGRPAQVLGGRSQTPHVVTGRGARVHGHDGHARRRGGIGRGATPPGVRERHRPGRLPPGHGAPGRFHLGLEGLHLCGRGFR